MSRRFRNERNHPGAVRASRKGSNISNASTISTELEDGGGGNINISSRRRSASLSRYSMSGLSPSLAAAMLSLPWPPPSKQINSVKSKTVKADGENEEPDKDKFTASGSKSKPNNSRKFYRKRRSRPSNVAPDRENNNAPDDKYVPITVPEFKEVHTNWPGFDHEPVPNWKEKYMIAKPYPKRLEDLPKDVLSRPTYGNFDPSGSASDGEELEFKPRSRPRSKQRTKSKARGSITNKGSKPKQRVYVERIGSCIK